MFLAKVKTQETEEPAGAEDHPVLHEIFTVLPEEVAVLRLRNTVSQQSWTLMEHLVRQFPNVFLYAKAAK